MTYLLPQLSKEEFYWYKISLSDINILREGLNSCEEHKYSDGTVHHQTFESDKVMRAMKILKKFK